MKKLMILLFAFCFLTACQSSTKKADVNKAETTQVVQYEEMEFNVSGMTCTGCENTIVNGLQKLDGVKEVKASHKNNRVTIKVEKDKLNREEIAQKIETVGYNVAD